MTIDLLEPSHFAPSYRPLAARSSQKPRFIPNHTPSAISHTLDKKSRHSEFPDISWAWWEGRSPEAQGPVEDRAQSMRATLGCAGRTARHTYR